MSRHDKVPNEVIEFLQDFAESIKKGDLAAIMENYSDRWENIIKQNYRATSWPSAQAINAKLECNFFFVFFLFLLQKFRWGQKPKKGNNSSLLMSGELIFS